MGMSRTLSSADNAITIVELTTLWFCVTEGVDKEKRVKIEVLSEKFRGANTVSC